MASLEGRSIVLGVSGGIAAYKAVDLHRRLQDAGASVSPILTAGAQRFVTPTTFTALGREPAHPSEWSSADVSPHLRLGQGADLIVVAPATARILASYALGLADDLLATTLLATRAPVVVCPAMHTEMWDQPAVQANVATLRQRGVHVVGPATGPLAGGDAGVGRMAEPEEIVSACADVLDGLHFPDPDLVGLRVLVTAGGTREPIDAVRFLANCSSGKQGHALAAEAAARGASVDLVTTAKDDGPRSVDVVAAGSAQEMHDAVLERSHAADIVIMAAAVADFRPKQEAVGKLQRSQGPPELILEPTPDILAAVVGRRRPGQTVVGFAAEWGDAAAGARAKLEAKGVDLVVGNDVSAPGVGFDHDTNTVVIVSSTGIELNVGPADKRAVARAVLDAVVAHRSSP